MTVSPRSRLNDLLNKRGRHLPLIAVLFLAAFLRFWNLDATEFKYDEATVSNLAAHFVDTGIPPVRGMGSSVGIDNPPLTVYLMALPVLLSRDPLAISGFVALLNVVGVWGCYALGRKYWGHGVGLLASLLLAVSPWAVFYSRKVWAQDVLLPFVILFFALLLAWLVDGRRWALSGAIVALAALTQIHLATLAFVPPLGLLFLVKLIDSVRHRNARRLWVPLLVGIGGSLLLYAPYLAFDALIGWRNARALLAVAQKPAGVQWEALRFALLNIGGREIHALAGAARFRAFLSSIVCLDYWPDRIEEGLAVAGLLYLAVRGWLRRADRRALARDGVLLLWLASPILFYLRSKTEVFPHYLIPLYPAPYLALAILAVEAGSGRDMPERCRAVWKTSFQAIGGVCLAALVAWQGYLSLSIHAFVETHDTPGGMGTPVRIYRDVMKTIRRHTGERDSQVVVLCPGDQPQWQECPAVFQFLTSRGFDLRLADYNAALLFPKSDQETLIVLAPGESIAGKELPLHAGEWAEESVRLREGAGAYHFYRLPAGHAPIPPEQPADAPVHLENGVTLLGYGLAAPLQPGQVVRLALYWRVDRMPTAPPAQGYSFTANVAGANGQRWGQKDGPGYPLRLWRTGDTLISWFDLPLDASAPPAPYHLRIGMYVYNPPDQFITTRVIDEAGQPVADAVEWLIEDGQD